MSTVALQSDSLVPSRKRSPPHRLWLHIKRHPTIAIGVVMLGVILSMAVFAHYVATHPPLSLSLIRRLRPPSLDNLFGTDALGRDIYSRVVYGAQISLLIGLTVAIASSAIGLFIGLATGMSKRLDAIVMRIMDGLMAIPSVLLAIALMALTQASVTNVIIAITLTEIPRVVRLVRGVVLTVRDQLFVEAAIASGTRFHRIIWRHILPNSVSPLLVQATYICASAMLIEATLSFLGVGTPPMIPSWGNIMADGRAVFQISPYPIAFAGMALSLTVLAVNMIGDGLRDALDPRLSRLM